MPKRACLVRHGYYPYDMLFRREASALRQAGYETEVLVLRGRGQGPHQVIDGIHVTHLPLSRSKGGVLRYVWDYGLFFVLVAWTLTLRHLRRRYDVIQVNTMPDFLVFATLIPKLLGAKVVLQMYEPTPELWATRLGLTQPQDLEHAPRKQLWLIKLLRWIEQASLHYTDAALAVTQQLKDNFVAHGANPDKISVVLNVPDTGLFEVDPQAIDKASADLPDQDKFVLVCHGAVEERYGHDTMLHAIAAIKDKTPNLRLRVMGFGSYCESFQAQIQALGLQEHVKFLGYVPLAQLVAELRRADAGIVAQKSSTYSNLVHTGKMYDFLNFGKPVIVSRLRAVTSYFDDDSLCFFTPADPQDLARAILELYQNPQRRQSLARHGARLYEPYRWENQRENYLATFARLESRENR